MNHPLIRFVIILIMCRIISIVMLAIFLLVMPGCELKQQYTLEEKHLVHQDVCPYSEIMIGIDSSGDGIWCTKIQILKND